MFFSWRNLRKENSFLLLSTNDSAVGVTLSRWGLTEIEREKEPKREQINRQISKI